MNEPDRRRALYATLGFAVLQGDLPELALIRAWLDNWTGIGLIAAGMARQGYVISLTRYDEQGWRATFYVSGMEHSATGAVGTAWEPTPFRAVQRAAWETLIRAEPAA